MLSAGDRDLVLRRLFGGSAPDDAGPPTQQEP
jgi:hypothetical protein